MIASSCLFDTKARKLVKAELDEVTALTEMSIPDLGP